MMMDEKPWLHFIPQVASRAVFRALCRSLKEELYPKGDGPLYLSPPPPLHLPLYFFGGRETVPDFDRYLLPHFWPDCHVDPSKISTSPPSPAAFWGTSQVSERLWGCSQTTARLAYAQLEAGCEAWLPWDAGVWTQSWLKNLLGWGLLWIQEQ